MQANQHHHRSTTKLGDATQDKRTELAELAELQSLLRQLRTVRQMPAALRELVAEKDYGSAVLLYSNAQALLQVHGHIGLLRPISREAHDIMQACNPRSSSCVNLLQCCAGHASSSMGRGVCLIPRLFYAVISSPDCFEDLSSLP